MDSTSQNRVTVKIQIKCIRESMPSVRRELKDMITSGNMFTSTFFKVAYQGKFQEYHLPHGFKVQDIMFLVFRILWTKRFRLVH